MEGFAAADGERILKAGLLAFGSLLWATPLLAQMAPDPLAPLPAAPPKPTKPAVHETVVPILGPAAGTQLQPQVVNSPPANPPLAAMVVPKDWRGVFDAIDGGNW